MKKNEMNVYVYACRTLMKCDGFDDKMKKMRNEKVANNVNAK